MDSIKHLESADFVAGFPFVNLHGCDPIAWLRQLVVACLVIVLCIITSGSML